MLSEAELFVFIWK